MPDQIRNFIALDVGERRIGVAIANSLARLPRALTTLSNDDGVLTQIAEIIRDEDVAVTVVGLPRGLDGADTKQTDYTREFANKLQSHCNILIVFQDETLTSKQAEQELNARGGSHKKEDIDALAAVYILEDYLGSIEVMDKTQ